MITKCKNVIDIIWPIPKVLAFSTTRQVPLLSHTECSLKNNLIKNQSSFDSFNVGAHVNDSLTSVKRNRHSLQLLLPQSTKIQWLNQVHGHNVVDIKHVSAEPLTADAAITRCSNIALAIMTADCLPILLSDKQGHEVAAIHGGWRPLSANIIQNTIQRMRTKPENIVAWLGPCISSAVFEVGEEVRNQFIDISPDFATAFNLIQFDMAGNFTNKYLADLQCIAEIQLEKLGVNNIIRNGECTFSNEDNYYSYRRDGVTGRMASIITII